MDACGAYVFLFEGLSNVSFDRPKNSCNISISIIANYFCLNGIKSITSTEILLRLNAPINKFIFIMIPFYAIYSLILLLNSTIIGVLLSLLFFSVAVMIPINSIVRSKKQESIRTGLLHLTINVNGIKLKLSH